MSQHITFSTQSLCHVLASLTRLVTLCLCVGHSPLFHFLVRWVSPKVQSLAHLKSLYDYVKKAISLFLCCWEVILRSRSLSYYYHLFLLLADAIGIVQHSFLSRLVKLVLCGPMDGCVFSTFKSTECIMAHGAWQHQTAILGVPCTATHCCNTLHRTATNSTNCMLVF